MYELLDARLASRMSRRLIQQNILVILASTVLLTTLVNRKHCKLLA